MRIGVESRRRCDRLSLVKSGPYGLKRWKGRVLRFPCFMKPRKHGIVQCSVNDVGVGIACWSVHGDRFPSRVQTISEGLICQTEFFDTCLGRHIKPILHLQYRAHNCRRRDELGGVTLCWVAMPGKRAVRAQHRLRKNRHRVLTNRIGYCYDQDASDGR